MALFSPNDWKLLHDTQRPSTWAKRVRRAIPDWQTAVDENGAGPVQLAVQHAPAAWGTLLPRTPTSPWQARDAHGRSLWYYALTNHVGPERKDANERLLTLLEGATGGDPRDRDGNGLMTQWLYGAVNHTHHLSRLPYWRPFCSFSNRANGHWSAELPIATALWAGAEQHGQAMAERLVAVLLDRPGWEGGGMNDPAIVSVLDAVEEAARAGAHEQGDTFGSDWQPALRGAVALALWRNLRGVINLLPTDLLYRWAPDMIHALNDDDRRLFLRQLPHAADNLGTKNGEWQQFVPMAMAQAMAERLDRDMPETAPREHRSLRL